MKHNEKISCVMVTKRLGDAKTKRSIDSFKNQTYDNKELIIVFSHSNYDEIYDILNYTNDIKSTMYKIRDDTTLGEARNISINISNGEWVCQWDDDDISHKERLKFQYTWNKDNNTEASILSSQYHIFENESPIRLYLENRKAQSSIEHSGWCGTILAKKYKLINIYPSLKIDEDTQALSKLKDLKVIQYNTPYYHYLYSYHGSNTWGYDHNKYMTNDGQDFSNNKDIKKWIEDNFNYRINYATI